jgi:hypothetical protein
MFFTGDRMGYVLPKGSSKQFSNYAGKPKKRRRDAEIPVKLPEPVRIPGQGILLTKESGILSISLLSSGDRDRD